MSQESIEMVEFSPPSVDSVNSSSGSDVTSDLLAFGSSQESECSPKKQSKLSRFWMTAPEERKKQKVEIKEKPKQKVEFKEEAEIIPLRDTEEFPSQDTAVVDLNDNDYNLLKAHFGEKLTPFSVGSWAMYPDWINQVSECPIDEDEPCFICLKLFFSVSLRGRPYRDENWFNDAVWDSTSDYYKLKRNGHGDIVRKFTRNCLDKELFLRNITRKEVLDALLLRFRGFYRGEGDCIDFINNTENWEDFSGYLKWKDSWDDMFKEEWVNSLTGNLFCAGCGFKTHTKSKKFRPEETYQVCSQEYCNFYYDNEKVYAIVKKENEYTGTFDVYK